MKVNVFGLSLLPASARKPALIRRACLAALSRRRGRAGELNVIFVGRRRMLAINKTFLDHGHDTDVIAFGYPEPKKPSADAPFGDVYVSAAQARVQARALGHSVLKEILTLAVHGTLHLVGRDDSTPRGKAAMFREQDRLLGQLEKN